MPYFYTAESANGSSTSYGFCNDTIVKVWDSKKSRDAYLDACNDLSVKAINRSQVTRYATNYSTTRNKDIKPKPFSGEYWGIETDQYDYDSYPEGYVGCITIGSDAYPCERFHK